MMDQLYLLAAIIAEVVATSSLKASQSFTRLGPSIVVVLGYAAAFYLMSLSLRTIDVGVAYAIWSGLGIVLVTIVAAIVYGQVPDAPAVVGMAMIIGGVVVINLLSKSTIR
ncbi:MAG: multidrug efflux SMR transporter [Gemmataceae bacterium]|nr:multidrug efflux SMR transporter [Gemmataceae bacterium]